MLSPLSPGASLRYFLIMLMCLSFANSNAQNKKMNVLFIAIDDLRPELGAYGNRKVFSPNIDQLANEGVVFKQAYCQQAVCAPSRNSIMTGLRPDSLKIYDLGTNFRSTCPEVITLPQHFKNHGYTSESIGKIYHIWHGNHDDTLSWSKKPWNPWLVTNPPSNPSIRRNDTFKLHTSRPMYKGKPIAWNASEFPEAFEQDSKITQYAIERLKALKDSSFFLGVGYLKPHLPFNAPKKFWDLYDPSSFDLPTTVLPANAPKYAMNDDGELTCCYAGFDTIRFPLNEGYTRSLTHGYYACISFIDAQIGMLRKALDELGMAENTLIVLWSDHGFKLGEYGHWCKHTNYEIDIHVPLMFFNPQKKTKAHENQTIVELLDVYPTICDEVGLEKPGHLQGKSLSPLIDAQKFEEKYFAISQWPKGNLMGYSLRLKNYHYIAWFKHGTFELVAEELYDLDKDPDELVSLVEETSLQSLKNDLYDQLINFRNNF